MTYQDDPNINRPGPSDEPNYLPWTVGGAIALAIILGIILLPGRAGKDSTVASNPPAATKMAPAPATTPPATTGSGGPSALPAR
jgi:hypothetical protein